jgi:hypothetical protein
MNNNFITLICFILLYSCNRNSKSDNAILDTSSTRAEIEPDTAKSVTLNDIIPDYLPDSSKVLKIKVYVKEINHDTSVVTKEIVDTTESNVRIRNMAKYRNDTLVKLWVITNTIPVSDAETESIYYFLQDELVSVEQACRGGWLTPATCDVVEAKEYAYLYGGKIIEKDFYQSSESIQQLCGCYFWIKTHKESGIDARTYEKHIIEDVEILKLKFEKYR